MTPGSIAISIQQSLRSLKTSCEDIYKGASDYVPTQYFIEIAIIKSTEEASSSSGYGANRAEVLYNPAALSFLHGMT
jgi:hypothetical protein